MFINKALEEIQKKTGAADQYALAKIIGVSQGTVSNYYSGKSYPTLEIAAGLYKEFGMRVEPFTELAITTYIEKYMS